MQSDGLLVNAPVVLMNWSFALAFGSLVGLWIVGKNPKVGWFVLAVMEVLWIVWSIRIGQAGLGLLCGAYFVMYCFNLGRSRNA
jgi:hypothetical protein